jgi:hypothetical protein
MKMKHLKKFENFESPSDDMGRFSISDTDSDEVEWLNHTKKDDQEEDFEEEEEFIEDDCEGEECEEEGKRHIKKWGDEGEEGGEIPAIVEKRKFNFEKKKTAKKVEKEDKKEKSEPSKGLTAKQKRLPEGLRKAIEARKKK